MKKIINYDNLKSFAYVNDRICKKQIKGIVIFFNGLNWREMHTEDTPEGVFFADKGILYVIPYNNPWAWMNKQAVNYTDEIIDVLCKHYNIAEDIPIVSSGKSMGGQSSLIYALYAKRTPVACVADCPVCDMVFHYDERVDLPRTLYSAFYNEDGTIYEILKKASPLHLVDQMPRVKYHIFHCDEDKMVNINRHSKKFVSEMNALNHCITLDIVEGRGHCELTEEMKERFSQYCLDAIEGRNL